MEKILNEIEKAISNLEDIAVHKENKLSKNLDIYESVSRLRGKIQELTEILKNPNKLRSVGKNEPAQEIKNPEWCSYKSSTCGHQKYKDKCKEYCRFFIE